MKLNLEPIKLQSDVTGFCGTQNICIIVTCIFIKAKDLVQDTDLSYNECYLSLIAFARLNTTDKKSFVFKITLFALNH